METSRLAAEARDLRHRLDDQPAKPPLHLVGDHLHLLVRERHARLAQAGHHVGDQSEVQHLNFGRDAARALTLLVALHAHVDGGGDFGDGGHRGDVRSHPPHHLALGFRLVGAPRLEVGHAAVECHAHLEGAPLDERQQARAVRVAHRLELGAELLRVWPRRRVGAVRSDMAAHGDDIAGLEVPRHGSGSVSENEEELALRHHDHEPGEEHDLMDREPLVVVHATLQDDDRNARQLAPAQASSVAGGAGNRTVRDAGKLARMLALQEVGEPAKPRTRRDDDERYEPGEPLFQPLPGLGEFFQFGHCRLHRLG